MIKKTFPNGTTKVLTISYDDGVTQDRRLVDLFNQYNLKGTFNLNSGILSEDHTWIANEKHIIRRLNEDEVLNLYRGHEINSHSLTHPHLEDLTNEEIIYQIKEDKIKLEKLFGYPITGYVQPFNNPDDQILKIIKDLGFKYSRNIIEHNEYKIPKDYFRMDVTAHHNYPNLVDLVREFLNLPYDQLYHFYLWGHSYEFDVDDNWDIIENFCKEIANRNDIYYATNGELIEYLTALDLLEINSNTITNNSNLSLWFNDDGTTYKIEPNQVIIINK